MIKIYTDGGCSPNPGKGAWAVLLIEENGTVQEESGIILDTTNNRMELQSVIEALRLLPAKAVVTLYTDSQYVQQGITNWIYQWKKRGWKTSTRIPVMNQDLWMKLDSLVEDREITWVWIRGHSGDPYNERVDATVLSLLRSVLNLE